MNGASARQLLAESNTPCGGQLYWHTAAPGGEQHSLRRAFPCGGQLCWHTAAPGGEQHSLRRAFPCGGQLYWHTAAPGGERYACRTATFIFFELFTVPRLRGRWACFFYKKSRGHIDDSSILSRQSSNTNILCKRL